MNGEYSGEILLPDWLASSYVTRGQFLCHRLHMPFFLFQDFQLETTLSPEQVTGLWVMAGRGGATRPNGLNAASNKICQFKLVLLGESAVGKSSLVLRFVKGQFHEFQESTIGAAFLTQTVCLDDTTVKFEIWDTAGQERYHSLAPMYYRGAQAAIVVYDITNEESFTRAKNWVKELQRQASPNIVIALAGNKADLANKRALDFQDAQSYADDNSLLFMETSAKTSMNVSEIFMAIEGRSVCVCVCVEDNVEVSECRECRLEHPHTVPADGVVGVEVEGHQAFWTCDNKPFILVLTTVPPHTDSLVVSTKTKAGLVTEDDPLPF
ncbi:hypothetical protein NFI96_024539 [Prochilodus magdalenae]|nr:hypothetical protein NFI96_024539 [Prochilodus magdalenae]